MVQEARGHQVHRAPPKELRQLALHPHESQPGRVAWLELDEDIDVALRSEVLSQDGPEEGKPPDVVPAAESFQFGLVDLDARTHRTTL